MMLDDRLLESVKLELHRDGITTPRANGMNFTLSSHASFGLSDGTFSGNHRTASSSHVTLNNSINTHHANRISTSSDPELNQHQQLQQQVIVNGFGERHISQSSHHHNHHQQHHQQQTQQSIKDEQYFTSDETNSSSYNLNPETPSGAQVINGQAHSSPSSVDVEIAAAASRHSLMIPTSAHCSDQQANMHYSLSNATKSLPTTSPSNMALNFSHDLLQGQSSLHHLPGGNGAGGDNGDATNGNNKHAVNQLGSSLDLDSTNHLSNMNNMFQRTMGLNFKHSAINEHNFGLQAASDMNSFPNWSHANTLSHPATSNMTHHILDSQHLIAGYPQHNQRHSALQLPNQQDLVGASLKSQVCSAEQASLMLSINQASQQAQAQMGGGHHSSHHSLNHNDSSNSLHQHLRSQTTTHDHNAQSYNLSMNDNQFYNSRSHGNNIKSSSVFLQDRSGHHSHHSAGAHHSNSHLAAVYHNAEHTNPQPTTSHHHVAGSSSGSSSRNLGTFKCPHCSEIFSMRNLYQSHLKSHSQEKGSKAKFHCELCGHSFSQKTSLNRHMKSHTGERPFPCEVCGKAFSEKERLKIHMRTHTGEKPFSCGICGKSFSQKSTVKRHQTVHTGEKKFKCDCGKGFANRGNLIAHIKTRGSNHFE